MFCNRDIYFFRTQFRFPPFKSKADCSCLKSRIHQKIGPCFFVLLQMRCLISYGTPQPGWAVLGSPRRTSSGAACFTPIFCFTLRMSRAHMHVIGVCPFSNLAGVGYLARKDERPITVSPARIICKSIGPCFQGFFPIPLTEAVW